MPRLRCRATTLHAGQTRPFGSESAEVCRSCLFVSINQKHVSAFPGAGNGKIDGKGGFAHSSLVSEAIMIRYLADFFPDSNQCRRAIESQPSPLQDRRRLASQKKGSAACNRRQQTAFQAENLQDPISISGRRDEAISKADRLGGRVFQGAHRLHRTIPAVNDVTEPEAFAQNK